VSQLSNRLHDYTPEEVLRGAAVPTAYDDMATNTLLRVVVASINASALNMFVAQPNALDTLTANAHEPWYDIDYVNAPISTTLLATWLWTNTQPPPRIPPLTVPPHNPYVPQQLELTQRDNSSRLPQPLVDVDDDRRGQAWFSQELEVLLPKTDVTVRLSEPDRSATLLADVATDLYLALVLDALQEQLYPARLAGIGYHIAQTGDGVLASVSGFSDKLGAVLQLLLEKLVAPPSTFGARFDIVRNTTLRVLLNAQQEWPVRVLHQGIARVLSIDHRRWFEAERALVLQTQLLDEQSMRRAANLTSAHLDMLIHGNLQSSV
jgi:insulysin